MLEAEAVAGVNKQSRRKRSGSMGGRGSSRGSSRDTRNNNSVEKKPFEKFNYLKSLEKTRFSPIKPKAKKQT